MKEHLTHILDQSVCLTRRQLRDYLSGTMLPIEVHAVEVHLASCPLCSMAMEGFEEHSEEALQAIASLNSGFLKEHFDNIAPQIHLNSMAPAMPVAGARAKKSISIPGWRVAAIAAAVLLAVGIFWYADERRKNAVLTGRHEIALNEAPAVPAAAPAPARDHVPAAIRQAEEQRSATPPAGTAPDGNRPAKERILANAEDGTGPMAVNAAALPAADLPRQAMPKQKEAVPVAVKQADTVIGGTMALRSRDNMAIAGGRSSGTKYVIEGAGPVRQAADGDRNNITAPDLAKRAAPVSGGKPGGPTTEKSAEREEANQPSILEQGNRAYAAGKYTQALRFYQKQMKIGDAGDRQKAAIMAARCYTALGNSAKAQEMLRSAADGDNARQRRAARRELRRMK